MIISADSLSLDSLVIFFVLNYTGIIFRSAELACAWLVFLLIIKSLCFYNVSPPIFSYSIEVISSHVCIRFQIHTYIHTYWFLYSAYKVLQIKHLSALHS